VRGEIITVLLMVALVKGEKVAVAWCLTPFFPLSGIAA
jgi:hypothetical protein